MTIIYAVRLDLPDVTDAKVVASFETVFSELLESEATSHVRTSQERWHIEALFLFLPDAGVIAQMLAPVFDQHGLAPCAVQIEQLPQRNWLAENRASFPALHIGRFWIYGSHIDDAPPPASLPLLVDAAQAFGSGTHPTTEGCLRAMDMIDRRYKGGAPRHTLDMGCGSAILGMAAAKLWPSCKVMGADNDPVAIKVAEANRIRNNIAPTQMRLGVSAGFSGRSVRQNGPYDIILANILAGPLRKMAPSLMPHLADNGWLILSGILHHQATMVAQAYGMVGARLWAKIRIGEWTSLVMRPRQAGQMPALWSSE
ncbi:50S ribosomal protein L11 methyltransferase [Candidatus Puniceispirillum marinum]|uniref:Ribosomal protein L11 methyltransferase n=1 Tax=Puniceispirillum marinum (strain IMCC1322) TaxID=488538 RepID=D5BPR3_PUNMI|nr:50S ribosomal protein L11 methyltransferase [Candidatus Puniceispirillum marinum]ADE40565.1 ribosomal L11 methyltransferase [Candidatus Puniceispirillum marinum IMCC1322]